MSVKTVQYGSAIAQDVNRGPSQSVWEDCPVSELIQNGPGGVGPTGTYFFDDFNANPSYALYNGERQMGAWNVWLGNNSSAAIGSGADTTNLPMEGDVLGIYGGTTAIDATLTAGSGNYRLVSPATGYPFGMKLWYECRVAVNSVASAALDLFMGFMDRGDGGTRITSAASMAFSATNTLKTASSMGGCIGFWKRATTNPTDFGVAYNVNNGTVQNPGASTTLNKILTNSGVTGLTSGLIALTSTNNIPVAQSFVKLGMIFDPTPSCPNMIATAAITTNQTVGTTYSARVRFFLNGQLLPWFLNSSDCQAATFPASFMAPVIAYRSGGTTAGIAYVDWVRAAQIASY